jgi:chromosome segregation ATPase
MSEETKVGKSTDQPQSDDSINNVKAEMNRKFSNYDETLQQLQQQNQQILTHLQTQKETQKPTQNATQSNTENLGDLIYDDPNRAAQILKEQAKAEIQKELATKEALQQKQTKVLSDIMQEFPEVSNATHPLTKRTVEIYNKMPEEDRQSPMSYKVAVMEAAAELGINPSSQRDGDDLDSFTVSGSSSDVSTNKHSKVDKTADDAMLKFASIMGLNVEDPKVVEQLNNRKRSSWTRYR